MRGTISPDLSVPNAVQGFLSMGRCLVSLAESGVTCETLVSSGQWSEAKVNLSGPHRGPV